MPLAYIPKPSVLYSHALPCQKAAVDCRMLLASSAAEKSPTDLSLSYPIIQVCLRVTGELAAAKQQH